MRYYVVTIGGKSGKILANNPRQAVRRALDYHPRFGNPMCNGENADLEPNEGLVISVYRREDVKNMRFEDEISGVSRP